MPGERLMCVWYAAFAQNPNTQDKQLTKKTLNEVLVLLDNLPCIQFSQSKFDDRFKCNGDVSLASFKGFLFENLAVDGTPQCLLQEQMEHRCYEISRSTIQGKNLPELAAKKLWNIFNRLVDEDSFPPKINTDMADWFVEKVSTHFGTHWKKQTNSDSTSYTFPALVARLALDFFSEETQKSVSNCVDQLHSWLVIEVIKSGWLYTRIRKQANWTNWVKRWVVLNSTRLSYHKTSFRGSQKKLSGELFITGSKVQSLPPYKSMFIKLSERFKVSNLPYIEMEMSADEVTLKRAWINSIQEVIDAANNKTTPIQRMLKETSKRDAKRTSSILDDAKLRYNSAMSDPELSDHMPNRSSWQNMSASSKKGQNNPVAEIKNNQILKETAEKTKGVFMTIDTDGNGKIDASEFQQFISGLGLQIKPAETKMLYSVIKKEGTDYITFQDFSDYLVNVVLNETVDNETEASLQAAFMAADRDGTGTLNFQEYAEYIWDKKRSIRIGQLITAFNNMDVNEDNEVSYDEFRQFYKSQLLSAEEALIAPLHKSNEGVPAIDIKLKEFYEKTEANDLAYFIRERWKTFGSFQRHGASGRVAMTGRREMVDDVVPGDYSLLELVCFSDLPPLQPKYTAVKGIRWQSSESKGRSGKLIFPKDFDGVLVRETATPERLRYYDCSFAEGNQINVSLLYRHAIQDFTYENQYLDDYVTKSNGGAGLEKHEFSHLDCPLEEDSGTFILAKVVGNDELHITAFSIPVRHTLYIPGGVIHSNDYLKGTWRTMLSDEADIDHVHLVRGAPDIHPEHFKFQFIG